MPRQPRIVEKAENDTRQLLEAAKASAEKEGVDSEIIVHEGGDPYKFIVEEAEKKDVDMIVMDCTSAQQGSYCH